MGNPAGEFIDSLVSLGLSQSLDFPGLEPSDSVPGGRHAGLNVYWSGRSLVIRATDLPPGSRVRGELRAPPTSRIVGGVRYSTRLGDLLIDVEASISHRKNRNFIGLDGVNFDFLREHNLYVDLSLSWWPEAARKWNPI